ncbi:hypothetical protein D9M70_556980 [compost metagenome]
MLLVTFTREREDSPYIGLAACLGEDGSFFAGNLGRGFVHLLGIIHDPVSGVLREDHEVHAREADLHPLDHLRDIARVF